MQLVYISCPDHCMCMYYTLETSIFPLSFQVVSFAYVTFTFALIIEYTTYTGNVSSGSIYPVIQRFI